MFVFFSTVNSVLEVVTDINVTLLLHFVVVIKSSSKLKIFSTGAEVFAPRVKLVIFVSVVLLYVIFISAELNL